MHFSGCIGILLAFGVILGDISLADNAFSFIYLPALFVCFFGTIGLSYLSYGGLDTLRAVASLKLLVRSGKMDSLERHAHVLRGNIVHLYACGVAGTMISFMKMISFAAMKQTFIWGLSPMLISLLPLFYALLGAEFLLRPAVHRLEGLTLGHGQDY